MRSDESCEKRREGYQEPNLCHEREHLWNVCRAKAEDLGDASAFRMIPEQVFGLTKAEEILQELEAVSGPQEAPVPAPAELAPTAPPPVPPTASGGLPPQAANGMASPPGSDPPAASEPAGEKTDSEANGNRSEEEAESSGLGTSEAEESISGERTGSLHAPPPLLTRFRGCVRERCHPGKVDVGAALGTPVLP